MQKFVCLPDDCRDAILEHLLVREVLRLQAASPAMERRLQGACGVLRLCLEEASHFVWELQAGAAHRVHAAKVVDVSHGLDIEEMQPPTSFLEQWWSRRWLGAKVAVPRADYQAAAHKLVAAEASASTAFLPLVRTALGASARLMRELRIERVLQLPVPAGGGRQVAEALPAGWALGLASYEHRCTKDGWAGTALAWSGSAPCTSFFNPPEQVHALSAQHRWDVGETAGLRFADAGDRAVTLAGLPAVEGFLEEELSVGDLVRFSPAARGSLRRLGRLRVPSADSIGSQAVVCFPQLEFLSLQIENFTAGTNAWPVLQWPDGSSRRLFFAQKLAEYIMRCFPRLRSARVFFTWEASWHRRPPVVPSYAAMYPRPQLTELPTTFLDTWRRLSEDRCDVSVEFHLWGMCFDSADNVAKLCSESMHQASMEAFVRFLDDELFGIRMRKNLPDGLGSCKPHHAEIKERDLSAAGQIRRIFAALLGQQEADSAVDRALEG